MNDACGYDPIIVDTHTHTDDTRKVCKTKQSAKRQSSVRVLIFLTIHLVQKMSPTDKKAKTAGSKATTDDANLEENATSSGAAKSGKAKGGGKATSSGVVKSGKAKGAKLNGGKFKGGKVKGKSLSRSKRAGLVFPVGRIERYMRKGNYAERIGSGASVYFAAVMEYLCAEVLELAGDAARDNKRTRITPRHLQLAIRSDDELNKLLSNVTISQGGVLPNILPVLLPKSTK